MVAHAGGYHRGGSRSHDRHRRQHDQIEESQWTAQRIAAPASSKPRRSWSSNRGSTALSATSTARPRSSPRKSSSPISSSIRTCSSRKASADLTKIATGVLGLDHRDRCLRGRFPHPGRHASGSARGQGFLHHHVSEHQRRLARDLPRGLRRRRRADRKRHLQVRRRARRSAALLLRAAVQCAQFSMGIAPVGFARLRRRAAQSACEDLRVRAAPGAQRALAQRRVGPAARPDAVVAE